MSLEFDKLLQHIKNQCHSAPGQEYLTTFVPSTDHDFIIHRLKLISDIQRILIKQGGYDFQYLFDIQSIFSDVQALAFNFEEIKDIINSIKIANVVDNDRSSLSDYPFYFNFIEPITAFPLLEERFNKIFDFEGNVLDSASSELKNIRQRLRRIKEKIQSTLYAKINDSQSSTYLQDKVITKRDERFVIPVKEGFAYMIEGISHGRSGSGASVYIEPKEVIPLNNELNDLISAEKEEIYRIFCEFTNQLKTEKTGIINNFKMLSKLDTYFACGRISNELQAITPEITNDCKIELIRTRHPLLILKFNSITKVIPFNLSLGDDFKILIISGPNTGGKSILLKSVGLCCMMALTGLPIPADYGSKIGIFSYIFSDIGDNQSIESSLSTFSGHIENIKKIIDKGDERSLVLIDEIGSATDPEQGASLAQAILEELVEKNVLAVITTHYTALKIFAEYNLKCRNASMQFDPEKHEPTYQFMLGFPGNSFAIEIAARLGLKESLVMRAKNLTGSQNVELTDLIQKINSEKQRLSQNNYQLELKSKLLEMKTSELETKIIDLEKDKKRLLKESLSDTQEYLTNIQKTINNELIELKKLNDEQKKKKISEINSNVQNYQSEIKNKKINLFHKDEIDTEIKVGNVVWLTNFETKAIILEIQKDYCKVDMNGIFFDCKKDDFYKLKDEKQEAPVTIVSRKNTSFEGKSKIEINLLGKTYDESLPLVQELIDNALFCGLSKVRIIHGRGTGILRQKIREFLKKNDKVIEFYSPPQEAGGDGVTVVVL